MWKRHPRVFLNGVSVIFSSISATILSSRDSKWCVIMESNESVYCQNCVLLKKKLELFHLLKQQCSKNDNVAKTLLSMKVLCEKSAKILENRTRKLTEVRCKLKDAEKAEEFVKRKLADYQLRLVSSDTRYQDLQKDFVKERENYSSLLKEKEKVEELFHQKENEIASLTLISRQSEVQYQNEVQALQLKITKFEESIKKGKKKFQSKITKQQSGQKKYDKLRTQLLDVFKDDEGVGSESLRKLKRVVSRLKSNDEAAKLEAELDTPTMTPDGTTSSDNGVFSGDDDPFFGEEVQTHSDSSDNEFEDVHVAGNHLKVFTSSALEEVVHFDEGRGSSSSLENCTLSQSQTRLSEPDQVSRSMFDLDSSMDSVDEADNTLIHLTESISNAIETNVSSPVQSPSRLSSSECEEIAVLRTEPSINEGNITSLKLINSCESFSTIEELNFPEKNSDGKNLCKKTDFDLPELLGQGIKHRSMTSPPTSPTKELLVSSNEEMCVSSYTSTMADVSLELSDELFDFTFSATTSNINHNVPSETNVTKTGIPEEAEGHSNYEEPSGDVDSINLDDDKESVSENFDLDIMLDEWYAPTPVLPFSEDSTSFDGKCQSDNQLSNDTAVCTSSQISGSLKDTIISTIASHPDDEEILRSPLHSARFTTAVGNNTESLSRPFSPNSPILKISMGTNTETPEFVSRSSSPMAQLLRLDTLSFENLPISPSKHSLKNSTESCFSSTSVRKQMKDTATSPCKFALFDKSVSPMKISCKDVGVMTSEERRNVASSPININNVDGVMPIEEFRESICLSPVKNNEVFSLDKAVSPINSSCKDVGVMPIGELRRSIALSPFKNRGRNIATSPVKCLFKDSSVSPIKAERLDRETNPVEITLDSFSPKPSPKQMRFEPISKNKSLKENSHNLQWFTEAKMLQQALELFGINCGDLSGSLLDKSSIDELRKALETALRKVTDSSHRETPPKEKHLQPRFCFFDSCELAELCNQQHYRLHLLAKYNRLEYKMCSFYNKRNRLKKKRIDDQRRRNKKRNSQGFKIEELEEETRSEKRVKLTDSSEGLVHGEESSQNVPPSNSTIRALSASISTLEGEKNETSLTNSDQQVSSDIIEVDNLASTCVQLGTVAENPIYSRLETENNQNIVQTCDMSLPINSNTCKSGENRTDHSVLLIGRGSSTRNLSKNYSERRRPSNVSKSHSQTTTPAASGSSECIEDEGKVDCTQKPKRESFFVVEDSVSENIDNPLVDNESIEVSVQNCPSTTLTAGESAGCDVRDDRNVQSNSHKPTCDKAESNPGSKPAADCEESESLSVSMPVKTPLRKRIPTSSESSNGDVVSSDCNKADPVRRSPRNKKIRMDHDWDLGSKNTYHRGFIKFAKGVTEFVRDEDKEPSDENLLKGLAPDKISASSCVTVNSVSSVNSSKSRGKAKDSVVSDISLKRSAQNDLVDCVRSKRSKTFQLGKRPVRCNNNCQDDTAHSSDSDEDRLQIDLSSDESQTLVSEQRKLADHTSVEQQRTYPTEETSVVSNNICQDDLAISSDSSEDELDMDLDCNKIKTSGTRRRRCADQSSGPSARITTVTRKPSKLQKLRSSVTKVHPLAQAPKPKSVCEKHMNEEPFDTSNSSAKVPKKQESTVLKQREIEREPLGVKPSVLAKYRGKESVRMAAAASGRVAQLIQVKPTDMKKQSLELAYSPSGSTQARRISRVSQIQPLMRPENRVAALERDVSAPELKEKLCNTLLKSQQKIQAAHYQPVQAKRVSKASQVKSFLRPEDRIAALQSGSSNQVTGELSNNLPKSLNQRQDQSSDGHQSNVECSSFLIPVSIDRQKASIRPLELAMQNHSALKPPPYDKNELKCTEQLVKNTLRQFVAAPSFTSEVLQKAIDALSPPDMHQILPVIVRNIVIMMNDDYDTPLRQQWKQQSVVPVLTPVQQQLLTLLVQLSFQYEHLKQLPHQILRLLEYRMFRLGKAPEGDRVLWCARFYAAICRALCLRTQALIFCWDVLYTYRKQAYSIIKAVVDVWPYLLPIKPSFEKACPNAQVMIHLLRSHADNHAGKQYPAQVDNSWLRRLLWGGGLQSLSINSSILCTNIFSSLIGGGADLNTTALVLLAKREEEQWAMKYVIYNKLLPAFEKCCNKSLSDVAAERVIWAMCSILRALSPERNGPASHSVIKLLQNELLKNGSSAVSSHIKEVLAMGLVLLSRHDIERVAFSLMSWNPDHGQTSGYSALLLQYLTSMIKTGTRPTVWWWKHLKESSIANSNL